MNNNSDFKRKEDVESFELRAGSRTYFFDVKETRSGEYYMVITESKKARDGQDRNERHRLFLYREDMEAFLEKMTEAKDLILDKQPLKEEERRQVKPIEENGTPDFGEISFEDL